MNAARQQTMPFAMTVGAGRQNAQGKYERCDATVEAVAECIRAQPEGIENWFSLHLWEKNYRKTENWLASSGIVIDVDYDVEKVKAPDNLQNQLLSLALDGDLPGSIFYLTPRGCRVIWVYERPCSEREIQQKAERAAGAMLAKIIPGGYHVDEPLLGELARFFYTPNCTAKEVKRNAEVIVMRSDITDPFEMATRAPLPRPTPIPQRTQAPISLDLASATERWNRDHQESYPKDSGDCPMCGHSGCFGRLKDNEDRWYCFSTDHPDGVGVRGEKGHHGDALDIEAHRRGVKPSEVLKADGYYAKNAPTPQKQASETPQETKESIFSDLIELGDALTEELISLQKEPLSTGIPEIDERLGGGYFCGELIVVQASTGVGKTSFNLFTQCTGVALDEQRSGLYITTEMQPHELQARRACQVLNEQGVRCTWRDVLRGHVPLEKTRAVTANTRVFVLPTRPSAAPAERIRIAALELANKFGKAPLIVADFLQALSLGTNEERRIAVGNAAYALQALAVELRTPVVAISSISRAGNSKERRESDDPYDFLNISKESGEIEYAAAVVAHLDVKAESDANGWRAARFILAKTRFGSLGIVGLRFHGASGRFEASDASTLTEFDLEVLTKIHGGTYASANAVAKAMGRNRPRVMDAVRRLQSRKAIISSSGYLQVDPKIADSLGAE